MQADFDVGGASSLPKHMFFVIFDGHHYLVHGEVKERTIIAHGVALFIDSVLVADLMELATNLPTTPLRHLIAYTHTMTFPKASSATIKCVEAWYPVLDEFRQQTEREKRNNGTHARRTGMNDPNATHEPTRYSVAVTPAEVPKVLGALLELDPLEATYMLQVVSDPQRPRVELIVELQENHETVRDALYAHEKTCRCTWVKVPGDGSDAFKRGSAAVRVPALTDAQVGKLAADWLGSELSTSNGCHTLSLMVAHRNWVRKNARTVCGVFSQATHDEQLAYECTHGCLRDWQFEEPEPNEE